MNLDMIKQMAMQLASSLHGDYEHYTKEEFNEIFNKLKDYYGVKDASKV